MDPFKKFSEVLRVLRISTQLVGRDIFGETLRSGKIFYTNLLIMIISALACCYTVLYHDRNKAFAAAMILFGFIQSCIKYVLLADLRSMAEVLNNFSIGYKVNANRNARDHDLYNRFAEISLLLLKAIIGAYLATCVLYQLPKFYKYFVSGVMEPSFGIYFPMYDGFEGVTLVAMHLFNFCGIWMAAFMAGLHDVIISAAFANIMMNSTIIKRDLKDLKVTLERNDSSRDEIKSRFLKVMQVHMNFKE